MIHILPEALPNLIVSEDGAFKCKLCILSIGESAAPQYAKLDDLIRHLETKHKTKVQVKNGGHRNRANTKSSR